MDDDNASRNILKQLKNEFSLPFYWEYVRAEFLHCYIVVTEKADEVSTFSSKIICARNLEPFVTLPPTLGL